MKLPRTIRLDASDSFVFAHAAAPGEWAVTGAFLFVDADVASLPTKERVAFRSGFLGIDSFGFSTLAVVSEAGDEVEAATELLARRFVERLGAPDVATALPAAREEIAFAASLCDHPVGTLLALQRVMENGEIRERYRTLTPRGDRPRDGFRAFDFFETDDEPAEEVDLLALMKDKP
ncbi:MULTISPECIES: DUF6505 family protein [Chelatococcus]|uniref:Uncharacterized protein n=1 Tax=Chelatococcus caeni TaxID=1348468 RepID=A0A840BS53_9HYPH|nr:MULTISPECIES: DUF6505 family protein [Chelatococcus]ALA18430.1 hypothetical protein AL346_14705 [Chelatococcus sp. CO-6]MBB4015604.1 hypothetical protein [Chelatococcus caeni]